MPKDSIRLIETMFSGLNQRRACSFPSPGTLAGQLSSIAKTSSLAPANSNILGCFASAAVEMWLRSLHSFLISSSLTDISPIWSSVSGYYSSHYSIRGFAHLFGIFQLHKIKKAIYLIPGVSGYQLNIVGKGSGDGEHKFYWKKVCEHKLLTGGTLFYENDDRPESDCGHRHKANYWDHIDNFPPFNPLDQQTLQRRIEQISHIEISSIRKPNSNKFPDIDNVQIMAYYRIIRFRKMLDNILKTTNRFWNVNRNPSWCQKLMNYHIPDPVLKTLMR